MNLLNKILVILAVTLTGNAFANITCSTPRANKVFRIDDHSVAFLQKKFQIGGREIASDENKVFGVRTKNVNNGYTKVLQYENHRHTIHIEDKNNFSEINDYLVVRSQDGHEMTYPISCHQS